VNKYFNKYFEDNMTMEEYENNFLELLRYVGFIKEEKAKI